MIRFARLAKRGVWLSSRLSLFVFDKGLGATVVFLAACAFTRLAARPFHQTCVCLDVYDSLGSLCVHWLYVQVVCDFARMGDNLSS